ncbi:MAG: hypothetical protein LUC88_02970 [Prevotella sp.]|nr:hypothetical protein [Prevotella sp.]
MWKYLPVVPDAAGTSKFKGDHRGSTHHRQHSNVGGIVRRDAKRILFP